MSTNASCKVVEGCQATLLSEPNNALTLLDILKLCVPFAFALALIWVREWYLAKRERKQKQDTLWRILTHELHDILDSREKLEDMVQSYEQDEISPRTHVVYFTPVEYARRLAELDHKYAYIYSAYELEAEGARKIYEALDNLREQFFKEHDKDHRRKLGQAIMKQTELLREEQITLLEKELAVLKRIQEARSKDKQLITQYEDIVKALKASQAT
jgi:hypothetical protein